MSKKYSILIFLFISCVTYNIHAQGMTKAQIIPSVDSLGVKYVSSYVKGKKYILGGISISGLKRFGEETVRIYSGLKIGQAIKLPGDKLTSGIKKLYGTKQFSNIDIYIDKIDGETAYLEFRVKELSQLSKIKITGVNKNKAEELKKEAKLKKGAMLTENLVITTSNYFKKKYTDKGFLNAKAPITISKDTSATNLVKMLVRIDKGNRVKIKNISFEGNTAFSDSRLRSAMQKTKVKKFGRFWKSSNIEKISTKKI